MAMSSPAIVGVRVWGQAVKEQLLCVCEEAQTCDIHSLVTILAEALCSENQAEDREMLFILLESSARFHTKFLHTLLK